MIWSIVDANMSLEVHAHYMHLYNMCSHTISDGFTWDLKTIEHILHHSITTTLSHSKFSDFDHEKLITTVMFYNILNVLDPIPNLMNKIINNRHLHTVSNSL